MLKDLRSAILDLYIDQGDDYYKELTFRDGLDEFIDFTGYTFNCTIKRYYNTTQIPAVMTMTSANIANGVTIISMSAANTALLIYPIYVYKITAINNTETVNVAEGQILVKNF